MWAASGGRGSSDDTLQLRFLFFLHVLGRSECIHGVMIDSRKDCISISLSATHTNKHGRNAISKAIRNWHVRMVQPVLIVLCVVGNPARRLQKEESSFRVAPWGYRPIL